MLPHVQNHTVLCYVRPHAARTLSSFSEQTKVGLASSSLTDFHNRAVRNRRFLFYPNLLGWQNTFWQNFVARPMVRDVLKNHSLLEDFSEIAFGSNAQVTIESTPSDNESLSVEDLALLRYFQASLPKLDKATRNFIGWEFHLNCIEIKSQIKGTRLALDKATAELIRKSYLEDARQLDDTFFSANPVMVRELDRAVDTAIEKPQSLEISDYFSADAVRAIELYARMAHELLDEDTDRVRQRLIQKRVARLHGTDESVNNFTARISWKKPGRNRPIATPRKLVTTAKRMVKKLLHP